MWVKLNPQVLIFILTYIFTASCHEKGSLTFVIDDTLSMTNAINQVKNDADSITNIVFNEKASRIKNMVLVTFNDPYAKLETVTDNRDQFRRKINSIYVKNPYHNYDCEEPSMNGILYALNNSLPNSFVYVFTDASAKDYRKMKDVVTMCQKKQSQIVFVLTGFCRSSKERAFQVYYDIAARCSGLAIFIQSNQVNEVLSTIKETIIGNKTVIGVIKTPPHRYTDVLFSIDDQTEYVIITASGIDVHLSVRGPRASQQKLTWINNVKVIKISYPTPGQYVATVTGTTETYLYIVGRTDFIFSHGFSKIEPKSIKDTTPQPIADTNTHLLISIVDEKHTVNILYVQLIDMDGRVIKMVPLRYISMDFYTTPLFVAPSQTFKIVVVGKSVWTGRSIIRKNKIPITPLEPVRPDSKKPVITLSEGSVTEVEYGNSLTLTCKVSAYPEPTIKWKNRHGELLESRNSVLEPPYEYISYLKIPDASYDDSYTCYATNFLGTQSKAINVGVKGPFIIDPAIGGSKVLQYGHTGTLRCNIRASVLMHIYWSYLDNGTNERKRLSTSDRYTISADGTLLTINKVDLDTPRKYTCLASVDRDPNKFVSFDTQVEIGGLVLPEVNGNPEKKVLKGSNAIIECHVTGVPKPTVTWQFRAEGDSKFVSIPGSGSVLHISNVDIKHEGHYKCVANNVMGNREHDTILIVQTKPEIISSKSVVYKSVEGLDKILRIPCKVTGRPNPVITWEVNGGRIQPNSKYSMEEEALVIKDPKVSDSQMYICKATNDVGDVDQTFQAEIHQMPVVLGEKTLTTIKGGAVNIKCNVVKGVPTPSISWQFMAQDDSKFISIPVSDNVLRISHVEEKDAGQYKCVTHNSVGNAEQVTALTVQVPPQILSSPSVVYKSIEGKDALLTIPCAATGLPKPVITWKLNGVTITPSAKYSIGDGSLVIKNPKVSDSQSYTCEARNNAGESFETFRATILQAPQVSGPVAVTLKTDETFEIACTVLKGVPKPTITWQFMAKDDSKFDSIPVLENVLRISHVKENNAGRYKCVADNGVSIAEQVTTLTVQVPPQISSSSVEYKSIEGRDAILTIPCTATGLPKPVISWKMNGVTITPNAKYSIKNGFLVIKYPKVSDSQRYTCEARNDAGESFVTFQATIFQAPQVSGKMVTTANKGEDVDITCRVLKGVPMPSITWQFKAQDDETFVSIPVFDNVLRISDVEEKDAGQYKCVAHNSVGNAEQVTALTVQVPPQILSSSSVVYKSIEGKDAVLTIPCAATGLPKPVITWKLNGVTITPSAKYFVEDGSLVIKDPNVSDSQSYTCEARNNAGESFETFRATILQAPQVSGPVAVTLKTGETFEIACTVLKGVPIPTITWQFMAKDDSKFESIPVLENVLRISHVKENNAGRYKCVADNGVSIAEQVTTLTVQVPPQISSSSVEYKSIEGRDAVLTIPCAANGLPKPVISWKMNGVTITPNTKYSIKNGSLVIKYPKVSDSQMYTCEARNDAGESFVAFQATILQAPQVSGKMATTANKGEVVDITCTVLKGVPMPSITWQFKAQDDETFVSIPVFDNVLRISDVEEKDAGQYKCVAHNSVGNAEQVTALTVQVPPQILSSSSVVYKSIEGKDAVLTIPCAATGLPKPVITWKLNGVTITPSAKYFVEGGSLVIKDPNVSDSQSYTCEARNNAGESFETFRATILQAPQVSGPMAVTLKTGETFEIACTVLKGVPKPTITWQFMAKDDSKFDSIPVLENVLRISHVKENNAGRYKCVADNGVSIAEQVTTLTVQVPPQISSSSVEYKSIEGRDAILTIPCAATGLPKPVISWKMNGVTITPNTKYSIKNGSLVIKYPKVSDSQMYTCEARNDAGESFVAFQATILQAPQVSGKMATTANKGEVVDITCTVLKGVPMPSITWQFKAQHDETFVSIPVYDNVLRISDVEENDAGQYKCVAHNSVGNAEQVTTLTVHVPPQILSSSSVVYKSIEGKDAVLTIPCAATGLPKPVITWKLNGVTITPSAKYSVEDGSLVIKDPNVSDSQSYTCEARNNAGESFETFRATILQAPQVSGPETVTLRTGETFEIACTVLKGVPKPKITWQFMAKDDSKFDSIPVLDNVLRISHVKENNAGRYKCVADNGVSIAEQVTTLTVQVPPQISSSSVEYKSIEDRDAVLTIPCAATGLPKPAITWKMNGVTITPNTKYSIKNGSLLIKDPRVSDSQSYTCEARNNAGESFETFRATILQAPQVSGPETVTLKTGETFAITCTVLKGVPKPKITWQFMAKDDSKFDSIPVLDNVLRISHVKENNAGRYKCVADNGVSIAEQVTTLTVQVPPQISSSSVEYKSIEDRDAVLTIPCAATGLPKPAITWKMNGVTITPNTKYSIKNGSLLIKDPRVSDSQRYTCEARNDAGESFVSFQASILQLPQVSGPLAVTLRTGKAFEIACTVLKGVPSPTITWQFMGINDSKFESISVFDNVLRISDVEEEDAGQYKCIADNGVGIAEQVTTLTVQVPPSILNSSAIYKSVEDIDALLTIPCAATGLPKPVIAWKLNGVTITPNTKYSIEDGSLVIKDPKVSDSQKYTCEARNEAGSIFSIFTAEVLQAPKVTGKTKKTVKEGESVEIECTVSKGVPKPTITWQFMAKDASEFVVIENNRDIPNDNVIRMSNVFKEQAGRYKCGVENSVAKDEHITTLIVEFAPIITSENFTTHKGVKGDVALRIPCDTVGVPEPVITWKKNAVVIIPNEQYSIVPGALLIKDLKESDSNNYTCKADNYLGSVHATFEVVVETFVDDYGNVTEIRVLDGTKKRLECEAANPSQSVRWFIDGTDLNVTGKYITFENVALSNRGNYTCRVSDINGTRTYTYAMEIGYVPKFTSEQEDPAFEWSGSENDYLNCKVDAVPQANIVWTFNGKVLNHKLGSLGVDSNWGHYTCNVSNIHGEIQRNFDVTSSNCLIARKPKDTRNMPLVLTEIANWPELDATTNYLKVEPSQTILFSCPSHEGIKNSFQKFPELKEIRASCDKEDIFIVDGKSYKSSDFTCTHEIDFLVVRKPIKCLNENSELIRVGFDIHGFLETYEVCYDISKNIPLYTRVLMSGSNRGHGISLNWSKYPGIGEGKGDGAYTCEHSTSSCCYSKTQLVNNRDFIDGPAQESTMIDPLNAVPYWHPCGGEKDPWDGIENLVRSRLDTYSRFIAWSGIHTLQERDGKVIPRYLWKVLRFDEDDAMAIVYINDPSPTKADYLCKNTCADNAWIVEQYKQTYCCNVDEFLQAFGLGETTIGESVEGALAKISLRTN